MQLSGLRASTAAPVCAQRSGKAAPVARRAAVRVCAAKAAPSQEVSAARR
jgi:hypothetical protein